MGTGSPEESGGQKGGQKRRRAEEQAGRRAGGQESGLARERAGREVGSCAAALHCAQSSVDHSHGQQQVRGWDMVGSSSVQEGMLLAPVWIQSGLEEALLLNLCRQ